MWNMYTPKHRIDELLDQAQLYCGLVLSENAPPNKLHARKLDSIGRRLKKLTGRRLVIHSDGYIRLI